MTAYFIYISLLINLLSLCFHSHGFISLSAKCSRYWAKLCIDIQRHEFCQDDEISFNTAFTQDFSDLAPIWPTYFQEVNSQMWSRPINVFVQISLKCSENLLKWTSRASLTMNKFMSDVQVVQLLCSLPPVLHNSPSTSVHFIFSVFETATKQTKHHNKHAMNTTKL